MKHLCLFCGLLLAGLFSCRRDAVTNGYFENVRQVRAESVPIGKVIRLEGIYKTENYIVLRDGSETAEDLFQVYSCPDFEFLYSFGRRGKGPDEYLMPTVVKGMPGDRFAFRDHATDRFATYELTDTGASLIRSFIYKPEGTRFFWEINRLEDSLYLLKRRDDRWSRREVWSADFRRLVDSLPNTFDLNRTMGDDYFSDFDDCWIAGCGNRFACAYFFIDRIEFGHVSGGKPVLDTFAGVERAPDFYRFDRTTSGVPNVMKNPVYYENLAAGETRVYALYAGIPWKEADENHSSKVEVYDWNGTPVMLLELDRALSHFIVDEKRGTIYGFDVSRSPDSLIRYVYR